MTLYSVIDDPKDGHLRDESRSIGYASKIAFPRNNAQAMEAMMEAIRLNERITIQGALTGLAAAAVPYGGLVINTSHMDDVLALSFDQDLDAFLITVQPGLSLARLNQIIEHKDFPYSEWDEASTHDSSQLKMGQWFFAPDPTETSATIGGMAACNASGAKTYFYGPMRQYVYGLRMILGNGQTLTAKRGQYKAKNGQIRFRTESGEDYLLDLPDYKVKHDIKSAAGYHVSDEMDLLDLIVGSEGTIGLITELTLKLSKRPVHPMAVVAFAPNQEKALLLVHALRGESFGDQAALTINKPYAIEYFDHHSIQLLRDQQNQSGAFSQIPILKDEYHTAVYMEYGFDTEEELESTVSVLAQILLLIGCDPKHSWLGMNQQQREKLRLFRHACPECVNLKVDENKRACPGITKLGTDMSVPDQFLDQVMSMYIRDLENLKIHYAVFGHIGQNHLHVNVLPQNMDEYDIAKKLYQKWAGEIVKMGGSVAAEHGIGKLKTSFLEIMYSPEQIDQMRNVKKIFDPLQLLSIGNIFAEKSNQ